MESCGELWTEIARQCGARGGEGEAVRCYVQYAVW